MPPTRRQAAIAAQEAQEELEMSLLPPEFHALRSNWQWAATCHLLTSFRPILGSWEPISLKDLENDLCTGTKVILPRLMGRLLYQLNQDRKIDSENWQPFLRRAYLRRSPERTPFPPEAADEGSEWDWFSLDTPTKIDSLHCLIEWFFQNPERVRVRHLMRDDDEHAHWRLEPIGYDEDRDAYWYFGGDRLWVQHRLGQPLRVRTSGVKRKRVEKGEQQASKRPALEAVPAPTKPAGRATKNSARASGVDESKGERSEAERTRRAARASRRASAREEDWQSVPDAWLNSEDTAESSAGSSPPPEPDLGDDEVEKPPSEEASEGGAAAAPVDSNGVNGHNEHDGEVSSPLDFGEIEEEEEAGADKSDMRAYGLDSDSELTELTSSGEEDEPAGPEANGRHHGDEFGHSDGEQVQFSGEFRRPADAPSDFVEWETVCVTRSDWHSLLARFQHSTHWQEKLLYRKLNNSVWPIVMDIHRQEDEQLRALDAAAPGVKRSTRLAHKETEKQRDGSAPAKTAKPAAGTSASSQSAKDAPADASTSKAGRAARAEQRAKKLEGDRVKLEGDDEPDLGLDDDAAGGSRSGAQEEHKQPKQEDPHATPRSTRRSGRKEAKSSNGSSSGPTAQGPPRAGNPSQSGDVPVKQDNDSEPGTKAEPSSSKVEDSSTPAQGNGRPKRAAPKKTAEKPPPKKKARRTYDEDDEDEDDEESIDDYDDPNDEDFDEDDEEWELDCEVCGKKGRNPKDGLAVACCEKCNKWQHIKCHNELDKKAGRELRNWDQVDFTCRSCLSKSRSRSSPNKNSNSSHVGLTHPSQAGAGHHAQSHQQIVQIPPQVQQQIIAQTRRPDGSIDAEAARMLQMQWMQQQQLQQQSRGGSQYQNGTQYTPQQMQAMQIQQQQQIQQRQLQQALQQQQQQLMQGGFPGGSQGINPAMYQQQQIMQRQLVRQNSMPMPGGMSGMNPPNMGMQQQPQQPSFFPGQPQQSMPGQMPRRQSIDTMSPQSASFGSPVGGMGGFGAPQQQPQAFGGVPQAMMQPFGMPQQGMGMQRPGSGSPVHSFNGANGFGQPTGSPLDTPMRQHSHSPLVPSSSGPTMSNLPNQYYPQGHPLYPQQQAQLSMLHQKHVTGQGLTPQERSWVKEIQIASQQYTLKQQQQQAAMLQQGFPADPLGGAGMGMSMGGIGAMGGMGAMPMSQPGMNMSFGLPQMQQQQQAFAMPQLPAQSGQMGMGMPSAQGMSGMPMQALPPLSGGVMPGMPGNGMPGAPGNGLPGLPGGGMPGMPTLPQIPGMPGMQMQQQPAFAMPPRPPSQANSVHSHHSGSPSGPPGTVMPPARPPSQAHSHASQSPHALQQQAQVSMQPPPTLVQSPPQLQLPASGEPQDFFTRVPTPAAASQAATPASALTPAESVPAQTTPSEAAPDAPTVAVQ